MDTISVIIPTYNSQKTIERAIKSVLKQEGFNQNFEIEIFICDDCSTDGTLGICMDYDIKIYQRGKNSGGPNWGRNTGIKNATGNLIAFLDHDDEWLPNKLKTQLEEIKQGYEFVYSQYAGCNKKYINTLSRIYLSSILLINNNIPLFEEIQGMYDYGWIVKTTKDRKCKEVPPCVIRHLTGYNLSLDPLYREVNLNLLVQSLTIEQDWKGIERVYQSTARFFYKIGQYKKARRCLSKSPITLKNDLYYITSFIPLIARLIVKKFNVYDNENTKDYSESGS